MMSPFIRVTLAFLVINLLSPSEALRGFGKGNSKEAKGYKDPGKPGTLAGTSSGLPAQNATRRGLGISAWGIIVLVVTMVLADSPLCRACMHSKVTATYLLLVAAYRIEHLGVLGTLPEIVGNRQGLLNFLEELGWQ